MIRQADKVVIVEGYMDVIAAHQHGFSNVVVYGHFVDERFQLSAVAPLYQQLCARHADAAGQQATIRGSNQARQSLQRVQKPTVTSTGQVRMTERIGANLSIVSMPGLTRMMSFGARQSSGKCWWIRPSPVELHLRFVATQYDLRSAQGKGQAVAELAPLIAELDDEDRAPALYSAAQSPGTN